MRRALVPWIVVGLALVAVAVPIAQGTSSVKDPRVAGLIKKVNALSKRVSALETREACVSVLGIAQFGAPDQADGYMYKRAADASGSFIVTTSLDVVPEGQSAPIFMAVVDPQCVSSGSKSLYHERRGSTHRTVVVHSATR